MDHETQYPIDILANAAGITAEQTVIGHSFDLWQKVIDVNLNGVFRTTHRCLPGMIDRGWGRVINDLWRLLRFEGRRRRVLALRCAGGCGAWRHLQRHQSDLG